MTSVKHIHFFREGERFFKEDRFGKSIKYFKKFANYNKKMQEPYENIARCYLKMNDIKNTVKTINAINNNFPEINDEKKSMLEKLKNESIAMHFTNTVDTDNLDILNEITNNEYITFICGSLLKTGNYSYCEEIAYKLYDTDPYNYNKHFVCICSLIEYYQKNKPGDNLIKLQALQNKILQNALYMGILCYSANDFDNVTECMLNFKQSKYYNQVNKQIRDKSEAYYLSALLRSSDGSDNDWEMIQDTYEEQMELNNKDIDRWWFFTAYNVCQDFSQVKDSFEYILDLNYETIKTINESLTSNMKLLSDFNDKTIPDDKLSINKIDDYTQIVNIKNIVFSTHLEGVILHDDNYFFVGKNNFYPYTIKYILNKKEVKEVEGKCYGLNICNQKNYFHIVTEFISRLCVLEKNVDLKDITLLITKNMPKYAQQILENFDFKEKILYDNTNFKCEEIVTVDSGYQGEEFKDCWSCYLFSKYTIQSIYDKFTSLFCNDTEENDIIIYISRSDTFIRNIVNEDLLLEKVIKPLYGDKLRIFNKKFLDESENPFKSQVQLFNRAKMVIAGHGAALTNILFCKENTCIVEFKMKPNCNRCFEYVAKHRNLNHNYCDIMNSFYHTKYTFEEEMIEPMTDFLSNLQEPESKIIELDDLNDLDDVSE